MALNFAAKIYQILEKENPEIISWLSNGLAFRIVDHRRFENEVIPKYFHRKFSHYLVVVVCFTHVLYVSIY